MAKLFVTIIFVFVLVSVDANARKFTPGGEKSQTLVHASAPQEEWSAEVAESPGCSRGGVEEQKTFFYGGVGGFGGLGGIGHLGFIPVFGGIGKYGGIGGFGGIGLGHNLAGVGGAFGRVGGAGGLIHP